MNKILSSRRSVVCVTIAAFLAGCGGGGSGGSDPIVSPQSQPSPVNDTIQPTPVSDITQPVTGVSIALLQRIETNGRTINGDDFGWACEASARDGLVGYLFSSTSAFDVTNGRWRNNVNVENDTFVGSESFTVTSGSENSLVLLYEELGAIEDITDISFVSDTQWTAFSSTEGALNCRVDIIPATSATIFLTSNPGSTKAIATLWNEAGAMKNSGAYSGINADGISGKLTN